jgi:hypothetical protein
MEDGGGGDRRWPGAEPSESRGLLQILYLKRFKRPPSQIAIQIRGRFENIYSYILHKGSSCDAMQA